jgi:hypothetical protein
VLGVFDGDLTDIADRGARAPADIGFGISDLAVERGDAAAGVCRRLRGPIVGSKA